MFIIKITVGLVFVENFQFSGIRIVEKILSNSRRIENFAHHSVVENQPSLK